MAEFDFAKNQTVPLDKFEEVVPGKYRGLYERGTDESGTEAYVVSGIARGLVADYIGVSKSLAQTRADKKTASDESAERRKLIRAFEEMAENLGIEVGDDGVVAAVSSHINDLVGKVKGGDELRVNLDKIKTEYQRKQDEAIAAKDKEISERDTALAKHLISDVATREITRAKGKVAVLMPHIESSCKVVRNESGGYEVRVIDSQGDFRSDGSGGWLSVAGLVDEYKSNPDFLGNFESDRQQGGTGAAPGVGARKTPTGMNQPTEKSATQKISAGLDKMQQGNVRRVGIGS